MARTHVKALSRRNFLKFLSASPLLAHAAEGPFAPNRLPDPIMWAPAQTAELIASPK